MCSEFGPIILWSMEWWLMASFVYVLFGCAAMCIAVAVGVIRDLW